MHSAISVRDIQQVQTGERRIVLDGQITALIEQWGDVGHAFGRGIEVARFTLAPAYRLRNHLVFVQHLYQVGRRAATEPIRTDPAFAERSYQTKRIIDIGRGPGEMITVVIGFQLL